MWYNRHSYAGGGNDYYYITCFLGMCVCQTLNRRRVDVYPALIRRNWQPGNHGIALPAIILTKLDWLFRALPNLLTGSYFGRGTDYHETLLKLVRKVPAYIMEYHVADNANTTGMVTYAYILNFWTYKSCDPWSDTCNTLTARFMGPTWGPSGADRTQVAPCWPHELCYLGIDYYTQTLCQINEIFVTGCAESC